MFETKVFLTNYRLEINGRRYERRTLSQSSLNRLMTVINNLPDGQKTIEVEDDLSVTLYVFAPRKEKKAVAAPVAVMNEAVAIEPTTVESSYLDEIECPSCREIVTADDIRSNGVCRECQDKEEAIEEVSECDYCDGSGWIAKWRFGHIGGYETFKECPYCQERG